MADAQALDPARHSLSTTTHRRTARTHRNCDQRGWWGCSGSIEPGHTYDAVTIFPTHLNLGATDGKPYTLSVCLPCCGWYQHNDIEDVINPEVC